MKALRKPLILSLILLAAGAARLPLEAALTRELRSARLLALPLAIGVPGRIGQTSAAVALGGLHTLVATFLDLRALRFFTECRWDDVADTFNTIVELAPRTAYYWETGTWHQAYNASSYYLHDSDLPPLRRDAAWRASVLRGRAFLERGILNNPTDPKLHAFLGFLLTDRKKARAFRDADATFTAAAAAYKVAADAPDALPYLRRFQLYALARVPGREAEALALARTLYQTRANRTPTFKCVFFSLQMHAEPATSDPAALAISTFGSAQSAYKTLSGYWLRSEDRLPMHGVAAALETLETALGIPAANSVLLRPPLIDPAAE